MTVKGGEIFYKKLETAGHFVSRETATQVNVAFFISQRGPQVLFLFSFGILELPIIQIKILYL